ncbi:MAG: hypothetical protein HY899_17140, partial [Deltaproteobacteria bacterium]|nr:hypothetical protein [Deltaproteobacteria bacterium]
MKAQRATWWAVASLLVTVAHVDAVEETQVSTADDLCPSWANPCVISIPVTVDSPGDLDFGLRDVMVTQGGRLRAERAAILCGTFWIEGPDARIGIIIPDTDAYASFSITARRGCSLSESTPCLDDAACASSGLGTCSIGDGTISLNAKIDGERNLGPDVELRAAGDIVVGNSITINGTGLEGSAGNLTLHSFTGNVLMAGTIKIKPAPPRGKPQNGGSYVGYAGELTVVAENDVEVSAAVDMSDASCCSAMNFDAGRDLRIRHNLSRNGLSEADEGEGGPAHMYTGRDLIVEPHGPTDDETFITANGGNMLFHSDNYSYWEAGRGGYTKIHTRGAFLVERKAQFHSDSPRDDCADGLPYGGNFYIDADDGFFIDGPITSRATGCGGRGGYVYLDSYGDGTIGPHGVVDVSATRAGRVILDASGNLDVIGTIDTRGDTYTYSYGYGDPSFSGNGGWVRLEGDDLTVSGDVLLGGVEGGSSFAADACRIRATSTARIDNRCPEVYCEEEWGEEVFYAGQSMIAEPGSRIVAEAGSSAKIYYGDPNRPPVLGGTFEPAPALVYKSGLGNKYRCPPCGDGEIAEGETCDDWNVTDGDGCSATCVNEHCIAETPGYPANPLCDDAGDCTNDRCDPLAGVCVHEPACADAFACTEEACVDGACSVTAVDALCDDDDQCTTDLCNTATGCVHSGLVGVACDDNDLCTQTSACEDTAGCVAADPRSALSGRMSITTRATATDDVLVAKLEVPASEVVVPVTESGVGVRLVDGGGRVLIDTYLPGALFSGRPAPQFDYRFD